MFFIEVPNTDGKDTVGDYCFKIVLTSKPSLTSIIFFAPQLLFIPAYLSRTFWSKALVKRKKISILKY